MEFVDTEILAVIDGQEPAYEMAKEPSRGIFWVLAEDSDGISAENIFPIQKYCDFNGVSDDFSGFSSQDGMTYNHKETWKTLPKEITRGKPFDYYPRGRVEIASGKATIWMNVRQPHVLYVAAKSLKAYSSF